MRLMGGNFVWDAYFDQCAHIKIEEFNIDEDTGSVSNENIANEEKDKEQNDGNIQEIIKINHLSVPLIRLSKSQLEKYLTVHQEPNTNLKVTKSTSKYCEICDKTFSSVQALKMHIEVVHEGLKKFKCIKCGKSFSQEGYLKRHNEVVHEDLKKYKCKSCDKTFSSVYYLKMHEGAKKYKWVHCKRWDKTFKVQCVQML